MVSLYHGLLNEAVLALNAISVTVVYNRVRTLQASWIPGEHRSVPGLPEVPKRES